MKIWYNDNDPFCCACLAELMRDGLIPEGIIDNRSISDIQPEDLTDYDQCHFFAGIGGWPYALGLGGFGNRPVWTGSCPCQPFSAAGKRQGTADKRHLWPVFERLIAVCKPPVVFGEQVASKDGRVWLARVRADLEALGYGVGAADLCAAGVGAPHIRQRLYWVAESEVEQHDGNGELQSSGQHGQQSGQSSSTSLGQGDTADTASADSERLGDTTLPQGTRQQCERFDVLGASSESSGVEHAESNGREQRRPESVWRGALVRCSDGKQRRVPANEAGEPEPEIFPLAHGVLNRVGTLRGAGNAIVPQVAAEFIKAYLEARA